MVLGVAATVAVAIILAISQTGARRHVIVYRLASASKMQLIPHQVKLGAGSGTARYFLRYSAQNP
jgi:hypothetical protein